VTGSPIPAARGDDSRTERAADRRFVFLFHPRAAAGRSGSRLARRLAAEAWLGDRSVVREATSPADVLDCVRDMDGAVAVAVGGDGTANMVATAVVREGARRPMAVLPFGTGNAFAHSLGIGSTRAAVAALRAGAVRTLDVLRTDHPSMPLALVSVSCGFEARYIGRYARLRRWTRPLAAVLACSALAERRAGEVRITADGRALAASGPALFNAGIYNHRCYLRGLEVWQDSDPADGLAEAVAFASAVAYGRILLHGLRTAMPALADGDPIWTRCSRAVLEGPGLFQVDGESIAASTIGVAVERGALDVVAP
jgi:diacylglycerol kinase (ATP)